MRNCLCPCHGIDGNYVGDKYFACKLCYSANHMGSLPRQHEQQPERKPRKKAVKANG